MPFLVGAQASIVADGCLIAQPASSEFPPLAWYSLCELPEAGDALPPARVEYSASRIHPAALLHAGTMRLIPDRAPRLRSPAGLRENLCGVGSHGPQAVMAAVVLGGWL